MRFKYKPRWEHSPKPDPERCVAAVHDAETRGGRSHQCRRKRAVGEWCQQHAELPKAGTGTVLWSTTTDNGWGSREATVKLSSVKVLKETAKQYKLDGSHSAFGYKNTLNKCDMLRGGRFSGAVFTDPRSALLWLEDDLAKNRERLVKQIANIDTQLQQVNGLLEEHPEEEEEA